MARAKYSIIRWIYFEVERTWNSIKDKEWIDNGSTLGLLLGNLVWI
jgi:hypothetical protein